MTTPRVPELGADLPETPGVSRMAYSVDGEVPPELAPHYRAPEFYGLKVPLPVQRELNSGVPGSVGLKLALQWALTSSQGGFPEAFAPTGEFSDQVGALVDHHGSVPVVAVCASAAEVERMTGDYLRDFYLAAGDAARRHASPSIVSHRIPDTLSVPLEPVVHGPLSSEQQGFVSRWESFLPEVFGSAYGRLLLAPHLLDELVGTFYSYVPSERRSRLMNLDHIHEAEKRFSSADVFIAALEDREGDPWAVLRDFVEFFLPQEVSRVSLWDRVRAMDPAWADFLARDFPDQARALHQANRFSLDQVRQVVAEWQIDFTEMEVQGLFDFLNHRPLSGGKEAVLKSLLGKIVLNCRKVALAVDKRVGSTSGAVFVVQKGTLQEPLASWLDEWKRLGRASNRPLIVECEGGPLNESTARELALDGFGLPFANGLSAHVRGLGGTGSALADFMQDALKEHEALADLAFRRSGYENRFSDERVDRLGIEAREVKLEGHRRGYARRVQRIFGFLRPGLEGLSSEDETIELRRMLDPDAVEWVASMRDTAEALSVFFQPQERLLFRLEAPLPSVRNPAIKRCAYSSLRFLLRRLLPIELRQRFMRFDRPRGRWLEVQSVRDHWRDKLGDAALSNAMAMSDIDEAFLDQAAFLTEDHLRQCGLIDQWQLTPEEIPVMLALLEGRLEENSAVADRLVHRLFYGFNGFSPQEAGGRLRRHATVLMDMDTDVADVESVAFLKTHLQYCHDQPENAFEGAPLVVVALPNLATDARLGLKLLEANFSQAVDTFVGLVRARQMAQVVPCWNTVHGWAMKIAQHADVQGSERILTSGCERVLGTFGYAGLEAFWVDILNRRTNEPSPKAIHSFVQLFAQSFLTIFQVQGHVALHQGRHEYAGTALRTLDHYCRYMEEVFGREDFGAYPFERGQFVDQAEACLKLLFDGCLVLKRPIRDEQFGKNKQMAAEHYRGVYHRLIGADELRRRLSEENAVAVLSSVPLGVYADMVCDYLRGDPQFYANIVVGSQRTFFAATTEGYADRLKEFLNESVPFMVGDSQVGLPGCAPIRTPESAVRSPVAVMVMESLYRLCLDADAPDREVNVPAWKDFYASLVSLFPRLSEGSSTAFESATFWDYQLLLTAEHFSREVLLDLDAAEGHRRAAQDLLKDRSEYDPEYLRTSQHFRAEIERARFEQGFLQVREMVQQGLPFHDQVVSFLQPAIDSLMRALAIERELLRIIDWRRMNAPEVDGNLAIPDGHVVEYRCTEFQLLIHLKSLLLFLEPIFDHEPNKVSRAALFHGHPGSIAAEIDSGLEQSSAELQVLLRASSFHYRQFWIESIILPQCLHPATRLNVKGASAFWAPFVESWKAFSDEPQA